MVKQESYLTDVIHKFILSRVPEDFSRLDIFLQQRQMQRKLYKLDT